MLVPIVVVVAGSIAVGLAIGRVAALVLPPALVAVFYIGLNAEVWGSGVGDGWPYAMAILMIAGAVGAALGVAARRVVPRAPRTA